MVECRDRDVTRERSVLPVGLPRRSTGGRLAITEALDLVVDDVRSEPVSPLDQVRDDLPRWRVLRQRSDQMGHDGGELVLRDLMREVRCSQTGGGDRLRSRPTQQVVQEQDVVAP